ncbi:Regulatory P domain of the subtilisin-like proprotein convertase [Gemmobacter aquatilis]|uniref:Regulatory P domain of the subtilisin-like proprotein convertase n=1 Tax=Gemmobacter aquatilis TaxID=933059 RepID=A0A1H8N1K0_9RHOB|nr:S8 family serine peptidase [Gemmobacter aquatilis]SEO23373.1 Regulatory P domain of the subtilisin-like proprotein convertase [Gemmobacter aquatilis]
MTTPSDPLFTSQWHFALLGDIQTIWDEYTGDGVHVGVYDSGVDLTHEDLAANYDASRHVVDGSLNPIIGNATGPHGTSVAGLIGADNNGVGGVGVAFDSSITSVNIFDSARYGYVNAADINPFLDVVGQAASRFDISSNSWGATPNFSGSQNLNSGGFADQLDVVYGTLSATGRGGLGTIITQASGNDNRDANGDGVNASRFTITVAATEQTGIAASYSNFGASILIAAPAAAVTTDLTGAPGYDAGNYTSTFNGTSAATPVVSGVIALMLEANPNLGWRDVQNILANSASLTGASFNAVAPNATEEGLWQVNHSGTWNGGGNHIHTNYGFGMLNAYNATRMAEVWHLFDEAQTSVNEATATSFNDFADVALPDNNATGFTTTFTVGDNIELDHVQLSLDLQTTFIGDLRITLTSAEGTVITVARGNTSPGTDINGTWSWGLDQLRGELSAGTWTLQVADIAAIDLTTLRSARLDFFGSTADADDVYHFTDEYLTMLGFDAARATISDSNGGTDWLDLAAVRGGINLNMATGSTFTVAGVNWAALSGTFENAVAGDGNDTLTGNSGVNILHGMRGDDILDGGGSKDSSYGGAGNDRFRVTGNSFGDNVYGGIGNDTLDLTDPIATDAFELDMLLNNYHYVGSPFGANGQYDLFGVENVIGSKLNDILRADGNANALSGAEGHDSLAGRIGADTLYGGTGNDTLYGGEGGDHMEGGEGDDLYEVNDSGDTIVEGALPTSGIDRVVFAINHTLSANVENMTALGAANINGTGNGLNNIITGNIGNNFLQGLIGADTLNGGAGNDTLYGGQGGDSMTGGAGNDVYAYDDAGDIIVEGVGPDIDLVYFGINCTLTANVENMTGLGALNINGTGNGLNNVIIGTTGTNVLLGLIGADTIKGAAGNDTLYGGQGADSMEGGSGNDTYDYDNVGDVITEAFVAPGLSIDRVFFSISYTLSANVENMIALGAANINGTGNGLSNVITGNTGNNLLQGLVGADTLNGGAGNDTLYGGQGADSMTGGGGSDTYDYDNVGDVITEAFVAPGLSTDQVFFSISHTLSANVENMTATGFANINGTGNGLGNVITGNTGNNLLQGLGGNDTVNGGGGSDTLNGGLQNDTLDGGAGADFFEFNAALGSANADTILNYSVADDTFRIDNAVFAGLALGGLNFAAFAANLTGQATDASHHIIYETDTGKLFFDVDGLGGAAGVLFATISPNLGGLSNTDFFVF